MTPNGPARPAVVLIVGVMSLAGCTDRSRPDPTNDAQMRRALGSIEHCLDHNGFTAEDVLRRYGEEPAFRKALDGCAADAGISSAFVMQTQRDMLRASGQRVDMVAACMARRGRPMQTEHFPDGSAVYGDLDPYFTADTMDEFFDDFAECNDEPRDHFPTEAERDAAVRDQHDS